MIKSIFHASYSCYDKQANLESVGFKTTNFNEEKTKDDFWLWVMEQHEELEKQYHKVKIDSISMI